MHVIWRAVAVLVTAAAGPLVWVAAATPAEAATCADAGGVSVVVDFKSLGGGAQSGCDADGGGQDAWDLFERNGFDLESVQRTPGFVCRVDGVPAPDKEPCVNTPPANAYWNLWWSDGKSGKWTYSSLGAASLTIPAGGSVALSWDDVEGQATPGVAPPKHKAAAPSASPTVKPTPTPEPTPTSKPTPTPTPTVAPAESPTPTSLESPAPSPLPAEPPPPTVTPSPTPSATETPADTVTDAVAPTSGSADTGDPDGGGGLPVWVPLALIVVLFGGAAALVVARRRSGTA